MQWDNIISCKQKLNIISLNEIWIHFQNITFDGGKKLLQYLLYKIYLYRKYHWGKSTSFQARAKPLFKCISDLEARTLKIIPSQMFIQIIIDRMNITIVEKLSFSTKKSEWKIFPPLSLSLSLSSFIPLTLNLILKKLFFTKILAKFLF